MTKSPALLLIDFQHDYLNAPALEPHRGLITNRAARLLEAARLHEVPVIHVWTTVSKARDDRMPHWKAAGVWRCVENTDGHGTPDRLRALPGEAVVHKTFFSAFSSSSLDKALEALAPDVLVLAGVHLHACVRATALDAYQRGFETCIADDATGSDDPMHAAITRRYLSARGFGFCSVDELVERFSARGGLVPAVAPNATSALLRSPGNPAKTWTVPIRGRPEVSETVERVRTAGFALRAMSPGERTAALLNLADRIEAECDSLISTVVEETGKPIRYARHEIAVTGQMLRRTAARIESEARGSGPDPDPRFRRRHLGNVAVISSWNNPVYIPLGKIIPALCYGNTAVWKPAEAGTRTASIVHRLVADLFPVDVVGMVTGTGATGVELINAPGVDGVSFTGSLGTGRLVQEACARRFIPLQAELGGNNAVIVMDDCDAAFAAKETARGAFAQAGQRCTATRRAIVMTDVLPEFMRAVKDACSAMEWGEPANEAVEIGPLISLEHKTGVEESVERARAEGCEIERLKPVCSFDDARPHHCYFPPAIVRCDVPTSEIVQEELFAPVLVIQVADSFDRAVALCNDVKQGLVASVFTSSKEYVSRFLGEAEAGILKVNQATDGAEPDVPFGGWKASGIGPAEHGPSAREFFSRVQAVYTQSGGV